MILTCPTCTMRYLVAEGAIGPNGRRVRCANCGHLWTQEPELGLDEELFGENSDDFNQDIIEEDDPFETVSENKPAIQDETDQDFDSILRKEIESSPIPEGVKPDRDDPVLAELGKMKKKSAKINPEISEKLSGYLAAGCVFALFLAVMLMMQSTISRVWPPSNMFYHFVGMKPVMPGVGLALEDLKAEIQGDKIFLSGRVINLKSTDANVPAIMADILDDDGKIVDKVLLPPPVVSLKGEGSIPFESVYPKRPSNATNVTFGFSFMKAKKESEEKDEDSHAVANPPPTMLEHSEH